MLEQAVKLYALNYSSRNETFTISCLVKLHVLVAETKVWFTCINNCPDQKEKKNQQIYYVVPISWSPQFSYLNLKIFSCKIMHRIKHITLLVIFSKFVWFCAHLTFSTLQTLVNTLSKIKCCLNTESSHQD